MSRDEQESTPQGGDPGTPPGEGSVAVQPARRPDASMTLLTSMLERPLNPGYAAAAEQRKGQGLPASTGTRRPLLLIWLLIIVYTSMNLPIAVWMLRSFLAEVPVEMLEAAAVDGAGLVRTLRSIVAPVVTPGIAAAGLICFIFSWNELLFARVLTGTREETAPVFLTGFITSQGLFLAKVCAASIVVSLPVLATGFAAQDKLVQGLSMGAVK